MLSTKAHVPDSVRKFAWSLTVMGFFGLAHLTYFMYTVGGNEVFLLGLVGTALATGFGAVCSLLYFVHRGEAIRFLLPGVLHVGITLMIYGHGNTTDLTFFGAMACANLAIGAWYFINFARAKDPTN